MRSTAGFTITLLFAVALGRAEGDVLPGGWIKAGRAPGSYHMGTTTKVVHSGTRSGVIGAAMEDPGGFGTLMQMCQAQEFLGKRVRMTGYVKVEGVKRSAGMWMRVDGLRGEMLEFDNMADRPLRGDRDWTKVEIVLDVPEKSLNLAFGILLDGPGKAWIDDIVFEVVGPEVKTTGGFRRGGPSYPPRPVALDFEGK